MSMVQEIKQWPVKIMLVHPKAPFLQKERIVIAADCSLLIYKDIAEKFGDEAVIIGCPMLEDPRRIFEKIRMVVGETKANEIEMYAMEVPCCHALYLMVERACEEKGRDIRIDKYIVRVSGKVEKYSGEIDESMIEAERRAHRGL